MTSMIKRIAVAYLAMGLIHGVVLGQLYLGRHPRHAPLGRTRVTEWLTRRWAPMARGDNWSRRHRL